MTLLAVSDCYSYCCLCANIAKVLVKDEHSSESCSSILDPHLTTFDGV